MKSKKIGKAKQEVNRLKKVKQESNGSKIGDF
jgi:hypothetical protein